MSTTYMPWAHWAGKGCGPLELLRKGAWHFQNFRSWYGLWIHGITAFTGAYIFLNVIIYHTLFLVGKRLFLIKGALDKFNITPNFFQKKVGIFIPLEVLVWVKTACRVLRSRLTSFWRNMNISSIFYFSKSTSINSYKYTNYTVAYGVL